MVQLTWWVTLGLQNQYLPFDCFSRKPMSLWDLPQHSLSEKSSTVASEIQNDKTWFPSKLWGREKENKLKFHFPEEELQLCFNVFNFSLINKHIWWEWKFQISNCILLLWRKLVSPNHSPSATMLRSRTWDRLAQGRRKVWCKTIFFQEGNWEAFAEWTGGVLGETRKKARIHTLAFSQPCLVDTTLGCQDTRWNTLDTDKARIKDFHHRHQNVLGGPQKGLLQAEKPEKWKARMQKSTASRNIMQITYTIKIFLITTL